ncbi:Leucine-rich repeat and Leucine-rich repeat, typical subtype and Leucine rich repeat 4-containing protein [Strongyloides ratti]|uniref:Leucine-rich repeat and Leucine-rich repeat, typical subtype and Leucine rich repeat 4-containing protein n=1 Tax=Strongyloides ratti TaxID=34506 RepID=A0A090L4V8_STRRB|nr:Leucine-rich repeat and Leucine-rich repeat, typical subtype and Leucine rich repeat 4-containing protein [Strongyloides ratti]CEF63147.1 Leucine-rich repeat and Leucine-rich repeat, typical subtype and Leucine rich repeat 4-containing protein [Strongyloides ratti]
MHPLENFLKFCIFFLLIIPIIVQTNNKCGLLLPLECNCNTVKKQNTIYCKNIKNIKDVFNEFNIEEKISKLYIDGCDEIKEDNITLPKTRVELINIINCPIKTISNNFFDNIDKQYLKEFSCVNCQLSLIPNFPLMINLRNLNLNSNNISISQNEKSYFNQLSGLEKIDLSNNVITSIPNNMFNVPKKNLRYLDLSKNKLNQVPSQEIRNSLNLTYLSLANNNISEVYQFQFMNLPSLKSLILHSNNLKKISTMAFMNVPNLQILDIHSNKLSSIETTHLQTFDKLQSLNLSSNNFLHSPTFKEFRNLEQIDLSHNFLTGLETLTFTENPKLTMLNFNYNNINNIERNSFNELNELKILLLAHNNISLIEKGMFTGIKNLQNLILHNNSINIIQKKSFDSLEKLTKLDLSYNNIEELDIGIFNKQQNLFILDLSNNKLSLIKEDTFIYPISGILLHNNLLNCEKSKINWLLKYFIINRVRIFFPNQPDITCNEPNDMHGIRLKDLLMNSANETFSKEMEAKENVKNSLESELSKIPFLSKLSQALGPNFKLNQGQQIFSHSMLPQNTNNPINQNAISNSNIDKKYSRNEILAEKAEEILKTISNPIIIVPGLGPIDISKLDKNLILHVLNGGQIPGIPKESLDVVLDQLSQYISPDSQNVNSNNQLYDTRKLSTQKIGDADRVKTIITSASDEKALKMNSNMMQLMGLLPQGYNISKIPGEVIESFLQGEVPDLNLLPSDLKEYFKENTDRLIKVFDKMDVKIDEVIKKLPIFERSENINSVTFSPYDLNKIQFDLIEEIEKHHLQKNNSNFKQFGFIALGGLSTLTVIVLVIIVIRMKIRHNEDNSVLVFDSKQHISSSPNSIENREINEDIMKNFNRGIISARDFEKQLGHY